MRLGLQSGTFVSVRDILIAGAGTLLSAASDQTGLQLLGAAAIVFGLGHFIWSITWRGVPWWKRRDHNAAIETERLTQSEWASRMNDRVGVVRAGQDAWEKMTKPLQEQAARARQHAQMPQWVSLDDAVRYLANYPVKKGKLLFDAHLPVRISIALRDALLCGDLDARGREFYTLRGGIKDPPLHGLKPIPAGEWDGVHIESYFTLHGRFGQAAAGRHESTVETDDNQGYHDIKVRRDQLVSLWPEPGMLLDDSSYGPLRPPPRGDDRP